MHYVSLKKTCKIKKKKLLKNNYTIFRRFGTNTYKLYILFYASWEKRIGKGVSEGSRGKLSSYSDPTQVAFQIETGLSSLGLPIH